MDTRGLMEGLTRWQGLKDKPVVNNHRQDAASKLDKLTRGAQQRVLNLRRLCAVLQTGMAEDRLVPAVLLPPSGARQVVAGGAEEEQLARKHRHQGAGAVYQQRLEGGHRSR